MNKVVKIKIINMGFNLETLLNANLILEISMFSEKYFNT